MLNHQASNKSLSGPCVVKLWQREECGRRQITSLKDASVVGDAALLVRAGEVCSVLILLKLKGRIPVALKEWWRPGREACGLGIPWIAQSVPFVLCLNSFKLRIMKWKFPLIIQPCPFGSCGSGVLLSYFPNSQQIIFWGSPYVSPDMHHCPMRLEGQPADDFRQ